ncbi:MAG: cupin domain-containing protein, partial [Gammaproteobacteria bacterium]
EPEERDAPRAESSAIHYLLTRGDMSALHRLDAPETWFHMAGGPVRLMVIGEGGRLTRHRLIPGRSVIVPAGCWQAAELGTAQWALMALTMRPGFHWRGFELADRAKLTHRWPRHAQLLEQVCAAEHAERPG